MNSLWSASADVALLFPTGAPTQLHPDSSAPQSAPARNAAGVDTVVANQMHHWVIPSVQVAGIRGGRIIYDDTTPASC